MQNEEPGMYLKLTDEELTDLLRKNDSVALETLFNRYYKPLCHFCAVYTKDYEAAEEIIADLFIKIWDGRSDSSILNIKNYLFTSARNLSINYNQKKKDPVDSIEDISFQNHIFEDTHTPFRILSGTESVSKILRLIDKLPERQREILLMSRIDQVDKRKISEVLGISIRTVETTLYQSIKELRRMLKDSTNLTSRG
ncbi:RNA polymerase sigma factor [Pedobacter panaciterrae]